MTILSKLADYGVIITTHLAEIAPGQATAVQIAADTQLPRTTVAKLLKLLAKGGVVVSTRGAAGGYHLARAPVDLSLADVVAAIDGEFALVGCQSHVDPCGRNHFCTTRRHWGPVNMAVQSALKHMTLAEMARPLPLPGSAQAVLAAFAAGTIPKTPVLGAAS